MIRINNKRIYSCFFIFIFLLGCGTRDVPAPIEELKWEPNLSNNYYRIKKGDTLYAVAFKYDKDYHDLARINNLKYPYRLQIGQRIHLKPASGSRKKIFNISKSNKSSYFKKSLPKISNIKTIKPGESWLWPVKGRIIDSFNPGKQKKGVVIAGRKGDIVHATAAGIVAYSGNGLSGYGNLIIIKHGREYLSAYGYNEKNLVKEGQHVIAGQKIAMMGLAYRRYCGVHFEIRKSGKPVNPLKYLQKS